MKIEELDFVPVTPTGTERIRNGKVVSIDEGKYVTIYVAHRTLEEVNEQGNTVEVTEAYPIRVEKPLTRDKAINAAEMQAYRLITPFDVASFGTSLGRKYRANPDDPEVFDHDNFINWVKDELVKIGL